MNTKAVMGTVVAIIIVGGGIYLWNSYALSGDEHSTNTKIDSSKTQLSADLNEALSKVEVANTPVSTNGWSVYQPKNLSLTFSRPSSGLLFQEVPKGVNIYADTAENQAYIKNPPAYEGSRPGMFITALSSTQEPSEYAKDNFPEWPYTTTKLFGQDAVVLAGQGMDRWDMVLFKHNDTLYQVIIQYGSPTEEMRATYYKILSTFTFKD
jgi:hypothetical protein